MSAPLVSVVVRSMGRPELALALRSLAAQHHPALEVIVVDATGGGHPPLPDIRWRPGHVVRVVGGDVRLPRPDAANRGLDAVTGEWFTFLDDDDTCEPSHLAALVAATREHPGALVVYGQGRLFDADGREEMRFGHPFNRALMHFGPLFYWQAGLIATRVRALGCRFDPAFDVCEDRDLLAQIAEHGDFAFVDVATFNYRPDLGTSGTGRGGNRVEARRVLYDTRLKAKWAGPGTLHWSRVGRRCRRGVRAFMAGDLDGARRWFDAALADYPDDPNALNGLARVALARGDAVAALRDAQRAVSINPTAGEYRATLALAEQAAGPRAPAPTAATTPARTAACPCGSGLRYKSCCGRIGAPGVVPAPPERAGSPSATAASAVDTVLRDAQQALAAGDAERALVHLAPRLARSPADTAACLLAARAALAQGDGTRAYGYLAAGEPAVPDAAYGQLLQASCDLLCASQRRASLWPTARSLHARLATRSTPPVVTRIAVAGDRAFAAWLRAAGGLDVVDVDDPRGWRHAAAAAGTLVVPDEVDPAQWLDAARPARVVVRATHDDPGLLVERLVELDEHEAGAAVGVTLPSMRSVAALGAPALLERPVADARAFALPRPDRARCRVGVFRGDDASMHANLLSLLRALLGAGAPLALPDGPRLRAALADQPGAGTIEWLAPGNAAPLGAIDIVVERRDPLQTDGDDAPVVDTQAAGRVVIAFGAELHDPTLIDPGVTGFLVRDAGEAVDVVMRVARDAPTRDAVGAAARAAARERDDDQARRAATFYRGTIR